jgi:hypothetical protein
MKNLSRAASLAAVAALAAILSVPSAAFALDAADSFAAVQQRHRVPVRTATYRSAAASSNLACSSGAWCGRQFVLMVGIAY